MDSIYKKYLHILHKIYPLTAAIHFKAKLLNLTTYFNNKYIIIKADWYMRMRCNQFNQLMLNQTTPS